MKTSKSFLVTSNFKAFKVDFVKKVIRDLVAMRKCTQIGDVLALRTGRDINPRLFGP